jgi:proline racemase
MDEITVFNTHCCGEIGDVVIGIQDLNFKSPKEASSKLFKDKKWRNFFLNEPRGGVFKHCNIILDPSHKNADAGFIIMEPEDNPPMSGSNAICVTTVLLEKNIIKMQYPTTELTLEAPGGLIKVIATCENKKVKSVTLTNLACFADKVDVNLKTKNFGSIKVSTAFGGDSFLICNANDFNLKIEPKNAIKFVKIAKELLREANLTIGFEHPTIEGLNYLSFCQFVEPLEKNSKSILTGLNTVVIRPGKLDRSPCGTGTSARLAVMKEKNEIQISEEFISRSIIGSTFKASIEKEVLINNKNCIIPRITGSAFITGKQNLYIDKDDPFPEGYRLNDTWPDL